MHNTGKRKQGKKKTAQGQATYLTTLGTAFHDKSQHTIACPERK